MYDLGRAELVEKFNLCRNKKATDKSVAFLFIVDKDYLLTVFANSAPALNLATFLAAILIALPV